jgi:hypothetical protein
MAMKLMDQVRDVLRKKHYSIRTEQVYMDWIKRYIFFHNKPHPKDMGEAEISQFISHLARDRNVAASTQNQALNAIVFLYKHVLNLPVGELGPVDARLDVSDIHPCKTWSPPLPVPLPRRGEGT